MKADIVTLLFVRQAVSGNYDRGIDPSQELVSLFTFTSPEEAVDVGENFLGASYDEADCDSSIGSTYLTVLINGFPLAGNDYDCHLDYLSSDEYGPIEEGPQEKLANDIYNKILSGAVLAREHKEKARKLAAKERKEREHQEYLRHVEEMERKKYEELKAKFESKE